MTNKITTRILMSILLVMILILAVKITAGAMAVKHNIGLTFIEGFRAPIEAFIKIAKLEFLNWIIQIN